MILFLTSILFLPPNPAPPPFFRLDKVENLVYLGWFLEGRGILKLSETSWMCSSPNIHLFAGVCHCLTRSYLFRQWDQLIGRTSSWLFLFAWVFKGLCPFSLPKMLKKKAQTSSRVSAHTWKFSFSWWGMEITRAQAKTDKTKYFSTAQNCCKGQKYDGNGVWISGSNFAPCYRSHNIYSVLRVWFAFRFMDLSPWACCPQ